jgi:hypothetical protein
MSTSVIQNRGQLKKSYSKVAANETTVEVCIFSVHTKMHWLPTYIPNYQKVDLEGGVLRPEVFHGLQEVRFSQDPLVQIFLQQLVISIKVFVTAGRNVVLNFFNSKVFLLINYIL